MARSYPQLKWRLARSYRRAVGHTSTLRVKRAYRSQQHILKTVVREPKVITAVVVHLYYTETWPIIRDRLTALRHYPFDLFITLPLEQQAFAAEIAGKYPNAYITIAPNRGRDVLPFMYVAERLEALGYRYVLKLHSKKSTHRTDGGEWLANMTGKLLPSAPKAVQALFACLEDGRTAVVGPQGQYLSLSVNFPANGPHIVKILTKVFSKQVSRDVQEQRTGYGFFAGTMFWARLDALKPLFEQRFKVSDFEPEKGQIDATFAHALERAFCLVPEIEHKNLYEISNKGVHPVAYDSGDVPDWSDVYIGPKA